MSADLSTYSHLAIHIGGGVVLVLLVCSFGRLYVVEWLSVENEAASHLAQAYAPWAVLMSGLTSKQGCLCLAVPGRLGLLDSS